MSLTNLHRNLQNTPGPATRPPSTVQETPRTEDLAEDYAPNTNHSTPLFHRNSMSCITPAETRVPSPAHSQEPKIKVETNSHANNAFSVKPLNTNSYTLAPDALIVPERFTKRIRIGNHAKVIPPESRSTPRIKYQWLAFFNSVDNSSLRDYVKEVVFYLHPSYKPDVIVVKEEPFQLRQKAWAECPIRIQVHFQDSQLNPSKNYIHCLSVRNPISSSV